MLITTLIAVTQKKIGIPYNNPRCSRLVIPDPISYDPLFQFVRLQTFVS